MPDDFSHLESFIGSSKKERTLRSDFLVHWTGKDIQTNYDDLCEEQRQEYLDRLKNTFDVYNGGLWMNMRDIDIFNKPGAGNKITFEWPATCFTEIKLSDVNNHTKRYGCLGFGFNREFVLERFGAPVQYVAGLLEGDMANDTISSNAYKLLAILDYLKDQTVIERPSEFSMANLEIKNINSFTDFLQDIRLAEFMANFDNRDVNAVFAILFASFISCAIFIKRMSDEGCSHKYELLDELEWRIPYTKDMERKGKVRVTNLARPKCKIPFTQEHLKILILPDEETRKQALDPKSPYGEHIHKWLLKEPENIPIIATVKECLHF